MREVNVGDTIDQYELTDLIARSGMASIFKAIDRDNGRTVAIKIPYEQFENDVIFHTRFQREEEVVRRLDHRHLVRLHSRSRQCIYPTPLLLLVHCCAHRPRIHWRHRRHQPHQRRCIRCRWRWDRIVSAELRCGVPCE